MVILNWSMLEQYRILINYRPFIFVRFFGINILNPRKGVQLDKLVVVQFITNCLAFLVDKLITTFERPWHLTLPRTTSFSPHLHTSLLSDSMITFRAYFLAWPRPITWKFSSEIFLPIYLISIITFYDECLSVTLDLLPKDKKIHWVYLKRTWEKENTR
jgi:hypothetical protein